MKKELSILLVLSIIIGIFLAGVVNASPLIPSTAKLNWSALDDTVFVGNVGNTNDSNDATFFGFSGGNDGEAGGEFEILYNFSSMKDINNFSYKREFYGKTILLNRHNEVIRVLSNNVWTPIYSNGIYNLCDEWAPTYCLECWGNYPDDCREGTCTCLTSLPVPQAFLDLEWKNVTGNWKNVTAVKFTARYHGRGVWGDIHYKLYEFQSFGVDSVPPVTCPDGTCDSATETCSNCPLDCGACPVACSPEDIVMKLNSPTNAHGALWNESVSGVAPVDLRPFSTPVFEKIYNDTLCVKFDGDASYLIDSLGTAIGSKKETLTPPEFLSQYSPFSIKYAGILNFSSKKDVSLIEFERRVYLEMDNQGVIQDELGKVNYTEKAYVLRGGVWENIYSYFNDTSPILDMPIETISIPGSWTNVEKVKVEIEANGWHPPGAVPVIANAITRLIEIRPYGRDHIDETDICYSDIFGSVYAGAMPGPDIHDCLAGNANKVLGLSATADAHAEKPELSNYLTSVCYGDLDCISEAGLGDCSDATRKVVARLSADTNAHAETSLNNNYPAKICCKNAEETAGEVYWSDLNGNPITTAQIGDTVMMIYENKAGSALNFNISEDDFLENNSLFDDNIRTINDVFDKGPHLAAKWKITQEDYNKGNDLGEFLLNNDEEFYFETDGLKSAALKVAKDSYDNTIPIATIIKPVPESSYIINSTTGLTDAISFEQKSIDPDDDLKGIWHYGDGSDSNWILNCLTTGNCNTIHYYNKSGTKTIKFIVEEMTRGQTDDDSTRVYVYKKGINIYSIIDKPDYNSTVQGSIVYINANRSHATNCSDTLTECQSSAPSPLDCYTITDSQNGNLLYCYKLPGLGTNYNLIFDWTFDNTDKKTGNWNATGYGEYVEFNHAFNDAGRHDIKLRVGYEPH